MPKKDASLQAAYPSIATIAPYQSGKPVLELTRELGLTDVIKLDSNENPYGSSPLVTLAITQELDKLSRYPDGNGLTLKQKLADFYELNPDQITLGNGATDVLGLIAKSFVSHNVAIVFSQFAFLIYPMLADIQGAQKIEVPAQHFGHDLAAMKQAVLENPKTKMVLIANPNNPTGTLLSKEAIRDFVASIPASVLVVIDEAYLEYCPESDNQALLHDFENVIIVRTFSKAYGLAGLRVGFAISHSKIAAILNRVRQPFNVSRIGLAAATAALSDQAFISESRKNNLEQQRALESQFDALGLGFVKSAANFMMVEVADGANVYQALLEQGVIVRHLCHYGLDNWFRVTICTPEDNLRLIDTLSSILNNDSV